MAKSFPAFLYYFDLYAFLCLCPFLNHPLKHSIVLSVVGSRHQTQSTNQSGTYVAYNAAVQADHHIQLLEPGNQQPHMQLKQILK